MSEPDFRFADYIGEKQAHVQLAFLRTIVFDQAIMATRKDKWNYYGEEIRDWYPKLLSLLKQAAVNIDFSSQQLNRKITLDEGLDALRLFNEKANRLNALAFTRTLRDAPSGVKITFSPDQPPAAERTGPAQEAIEAFALNIRFFYQKREKSSFRNLSKIYPALPISKELKERFEKIRTSLNNFLDSNSSIAIESTFLSFRRLFDIVLNGGLCHADEKEKPLFDALSSNPAMYAWLFMEFTHCGARLIRLVNEAQKLNNEVIALLLPVRRPLNTQLRFVSTTS